MKLNKENLKRIPVTSKLSIPEIKSFDLPEKVLQFGTGVLLRGLPDYFINKANQQGIFNGRVVVVKSTEKGSTDSFQEQDSLYTIGIRGIKDLQRIEENIISSAISRVLSAKAEWQKILDVAASEELEIIISNTTESGIVLTQDNILQSPPKSFPGKLLAALYHRYKVFNGDKKKSLVVLPTELITDNGLKLKNIVLELVKQNQLDAGFMEWFESCTFCNTLVDRIVPGKPDIHILKGLEQELGYQDDLFIFSEVYSLWAIEGDERISKILSFSEIDSTVVITPDITIYKELKLRLLNGTHSLTCAVAFLAGLDTVHNAMHDPLISGYIADLMKTELAPGIPYPIDQEKTLEFSANVLDRFRNPSIRHEWLSISMNYTLKLQLRVVPVLLCYYERFQKVPEHIAFGFAAYLRFMHATKKEDTAYFGNIADKQYPIEDQYAEYYSGLWSACTSKELVPIVLSNTELWGTDLTQLSGFAHSVSTYLQKIENEGIEGSILSLK